MSDTRFDVTFIRGPRDVSPWKRSSHLLGLRTNSPQAEPDALEARQSFADKRDRLQPDRFPNAMYQQQKGRNEHHV